MALKMIEETIGKYVIVRANYAGVFAGILAEKDGDEVVLTDCRRIWFWAGAASLSQMAVDGVLIPEKCRFAKSVNEICIAGVIEIIPTTAIAEKCIREVPVWEIKAESNE